MNFFVFKWIAFPEIQGTDEKIFLGAYENSHDAKIAIENWIREHNPLDPSQNEQEITFCFTLSFLIFPCFPLLFFY